MRLYLVVILSFLFFNGCAFIESKKQLKLENNLAKVDEEAILDEMSLHDAARINDIDLLNYLLKQNKSLLNKKDRFGYTPLHLAARFNHLQIAEILINNGATVNSVDKFKDTPLLDAFRNRYSKMAKFLLCNNANKDVVDKYGVSPLQYALKAKNQLLIKMLESNNLNSFCKENDESILLDESLNRIYEKKQKKEIKKELITLDSYTTINDNTPKICGKVLEKGIESIVLRVDKVEYKGSINNNRWCAQVENSLENKDYLLSVDAKKQNFIDKKSQTVSIHVLNSLYKALNDEFNKDFENWNAKLQKDTLTFRFLNPTTMFSNGSLEISDKYKDILNSFAPRYIELLYQYKNQIVNVLVQGHTSSIYRSAKTEEEKFQKNLELSKKRAQNVYSFIKGIDDKRIKDKIIWIEKNFFPEGKSSLETIKNSDGSENYELSRRVEFKIQTVPNK